ncbi:MAG: GyrI-like domain-containing protein [Bauldia sp.]|nr:GyrI-like domain-containing protein [Bauldia sp.]
MTDFAVTTLTPAPFAFVRRTAAIPDMPKVMGEGFEALGGLFAKAGATMAGAPLAHYLDYSDDATTFELGFPVSPQDVDALRAAGADIGETPAGEAMQATHIGPYQTVAATYAAMQEAMQRQGLTGSKDMWERYLSPPETPAAEIRTEVIWPVARTA